MKRIKIHFGFYLIVIASFFLQFGQELLFSYAIMILHELAHIFTAGLLGIRLKQIEVLPFGVMAKFKTEVFRERDEIIFSLAGPAFNLCLFALALAYGNQFLMAINLALFITNMLPIIPLDGGRALRAILSLKWGRVKAFNTLRLISKISIALLLCLATSILIVNFNISLLIIGAFLIVNFATECKSNSYILLKHGILNETKLKKEPLKTETLTVTPGFQSFKALKHFSGNNYYNIQVVENNKVTKTLTESELIDSLKKNGIRSRIGHCEEFRWRSSPATFL